MADHIDHDRRRFLGAAALAIGAAHVGLYRAVNGMAFGEALPAIDKATEWVNSPRLTASALRGKVVLVQFCTYTCINWLRTLPYVKAWAQKYRDRVVVVGVHTPEFSFERDPGNVRRALRRLKVEYPVVIDSDHRIWRAFDNEYWPALYVIDAAGRAQHHQFGEGKYDIAERHIQRLLPDSGAAGPVGLVSVSGGGLEAAADWPNLRSPENYLGSARTDNFASPGGLEAGRRRRYALPQQLALNQWALTGEWTVGPEAAVLDLPNGRIACRFHGRDLHLVLAAGQDGAAVPFRVLLDGRPPGAARGVDVDESGQGVAAEPRLYQLIRQAAPIADRQFEIEFLDGGVQAFAFTFG
jgi:thiol-disulfide isomerase/thioredoxin